MDVMAGTGTGTGMSGGGARPRPGRGRWLLLAGTLAGLCSADGHAPLPVSAFVMPTARIESLDAPAAIDIGPAQLARGAAEPAADLHLHVWSNSRGGYALDVLPAASWLAAVELDPHDGAVSMGPEGGTLVRRWNGQAAQDLALHVRFRIASGVPAGRYAWPLLLAVRPLPDASR